MKLLEREPPGSKLQVWKNYAKAMGSLLRKARSCSELIHRQPVVHRQPQDRIKRLRFCLFLSFLREKIKVDWSVREGMQRRFYYASEFISFMALSRLVTTVDSGSSL